MNKVIKPSLFYLIFIFCGSLGAQTELRIYCYYTPAITPPPAVNPCECYSTIPFDEGTITWNNRPPRIKLLAECDSMDDNCWYIWSSTELTSYVDSCIANTQPIVFCIKRKRQGVDPIQVNWDIYCKEQSLTQCPRLIRNSQTYSPPEEDARTDQNNPNTNWGYDYLWVCSLGYPDSQETFIQFSPQPSGVEDRYLRQGTRFLKNVPTLFSSLTRVSYNLLPEDIGKPILLEVYDVSGRLVKKLVNDIGKLGHHETVWDGQDNSGSRVQPGCYFFRLKIGKLILNAKGILLY